MMSHTGLWLILTTLLASASGAQERAQNPPFVLPDSVQMLADLTYSSSATEALGLDLFSPRQGGGAFPAVLFVACGGWNGGANAQFWRQSAYLAERQFVAATTHCRPARTAPFPEQLNDVLEAVRWLRRHALEYRVDSQRIAVAGASAGGHLSALIGMNAWNGSTWDGAPPDSRVQAAIAFNPVLDVASFSAPSTVRTNLTTLLGAPSDKNSTRWRDASPLNHVSREAAPVLLLHGTSDTMVPYAQSVEMQRSLHASGVTAELFAADGAGHGFFNQPPWYEPTVLRMTEFLRRLFKQQSSTMGVRTRARYGWPQRCETAE